MPAVSEITGASFSKAKLLRNTASLSECTMGIIDNSGVDIMGNQQLFWTEMSIGEIDDLKSNVYWIFGAIEISIHEITRINKMPNTRRMCGVPGKALLANTALCQCELMVMLDMVCSSHDRVVWEMVQVVPRELKREITFIPNPSSTLSIWILKSPKINRLCDSRESWERKSINSLRKLVVSQRGL